MPDQEDNIWFYKPVFLSSSGNIVSANWEKKFILAKGESSLLLSVPHLAEAELTTDSQSCRIYAKLIH